MTPNLSKFPSTTSLKLAPFSLRYLDRKSYFNLAISTFEGHSALQALQLKHRSIISFILELVISSKGKPPVIIVLNALALPRVECSSSLVAIKEGHIVPEVTFRHAPCPLHISIAEFMPPSRWNEIAVSFTLVDAKGIALKLLVTGDGLVILPGFIMPCGSNICLTCAKASIISAPNIFSRNGLRTSPSPCSPLIDPPYSKTRELISSAMSCSCWTPIDSFRFINGLMCKQPTLAWP